MPDKAVREKAMEDLREGKSASTAAGEFVNAEIDKVRAGEHGVRSGEAGDCDWAERGEAGGCAAGCAEEGPRVRGGAETGCSGFGEGRQRRGDAS